MLFVCQVSYGGQPVEKAEPKTVTAEEFRRSLGDDFVCFVTDRRSDYMKYASDRNRDEHYNIYGNDGQWSLAFFDTDSLVTVSGFEIPKSDDRFVDLTEICAGHIGKELADAVWSFCKYLPDSTYLIDLEEITDSTVVVRSVDLMFIMDTFGDRTQ